MQVTETQNEGLKRGYQFTLPAADLAATVDAKLKEAQPEVEMKGFRKGKVPMAMLKKQFGQRILGDAMQEAIDGALKNHLETSGDRPATQPKVEMQNGETWKEGDDVVVNVSYEALPAIPEVEARETTCAPSAKRPCGLVARIRRPPKTSVNWRARRWTEWPSGTHISTSPVVS